MFYEKVVSSCYEGFYFHFRSQSTSLFFRGWNKLEWDAVDAVSLISRRVEPLPFEHMPQMSSTGSTCNLNSPPIRIRRPFYGSRESFIECWPTTPWVELCRWFVQWGSAASTSVSTIAKQLVIFTCSRVPGTNMMKWKFIAASCF